MHHCMCVTHVPWCMSGWLTCCGGKKRSRHSRRMRTRNFTYLARGPLTFYASVYVNNVRYKSISIFLQTIQHIWILTLHALNFSEGKKYIFKSYVIPPNWHVLIQFTGAAPLIFSIDFWLQWQVVAPYPWQLPGQSYMWGITSTWIDFLKAIFGCLD